MSGPYQGRDLSNCGVGRLRVAINCGVLSVKKQEFTCQIHGLHMPKVMESLTILGCVEHIIFNSNLYAIVIDRMIPNDISWINSEEQH